MRKEYDRFWFLRYSFIKLQLFINNMARIGKKKLIDNDEKMDTSENAENGSAQNDSKDEEVSSSETKTTKPDEKSEASNSEKLKTPKKSTATSNVNGKAKKGASVPERKSSRVAPKKEEVKEEVKVAKKRKATKTPKEYEVEKLIKSRTVKGKQEFLVRWKGYSATSDTWEPAKNLSCDQLINDLLDSEPATKKTKSAASPKSTTKSKSKPAAKKKKVASKKAKAK